jgi:uncharacterized protein YraI
MAELTDEQITKMAKARVAFKTHAMVYVLVNLFLAAVWFVTKDTAGVSIRAGPDSYYWPIWTHLGWGLGLAIHGFTTYGPGANMLQREEDRIR